MASILELMGHVQQQGELGRARGKQNRLADLMGQAYQAPRENRQAIFGQMAQTDPGAAFDAQKHFGGMDDRARSELGQYAAAFDALPDDQKPVAYPQLAQQARSLGLPVPMEWSPEMAPNIQKLAQALGGGQQGLPAGIQEFQYMTQGLSAEDALSARRVHLGLDPRKSSAAIGYKVTTGPDGRPIIVAVDPREVGAQIIGSGETFGSGVQARPSESRDGFDGFVAPLIADAEASGRPLTPQEMMTLYQQYQAGGAENINTAAPMPASLPPRLDYAKGGQTNPFAGMSPGEMEAAKEAGKQRVQTDFLPIQEQIKTDAAIATELGKQQAQAEVELTGKSREKQTAYNQYVAAMNGVETSLKNTTTNPVAGRLPALTANQQIAEGAVAASAPVLKQLFRSAGEGVFTDKDQELLIAMLPTRKDHPAARKAKLENIDAIVRAKLGIAAPANGDSGLTPEEQAELDELRARFGGR